jgi:hypothetical protein
VVILKVKWSQQPTTTAAGSSGYLEEKGESSDGKSEMDEVYGCVNGGDEAREWNPGLSGIGHRGY